MDGFPLCKGSWTIRRENCIVRLPKLLLHEGNFFMEKTKEEKRLYKRLYACWTAMKARCYNPKNPKYKFYGAKGIGICDEWKSNFRNFYKWAKDNGYVLFENKEYKERLSIDRIEPSQGYYPQNCRFITVSENSSRATKGNQGRHSNHKSQKGVKRTQEFCDRIGEIHTKGYFEMYDKEGNFVRRFSSRKEIRQFFNNDKLSISDIRKAALGLNGRVSAHGYKWKYFYY